MSLPCQCHFLPKQQEINPYIFPENFLFSNQKQNQVL